MPVWVLRGVWKAYEVLLGSARQSGSGRKHGFCVATFENGVPGKLEHIPAMAIQSLSSLHISVSPFFHPPFSSLPHPTLRLTENFPLAPYFSLKCLYLSMKSKEIETIATENRGVVARGLGVRVMQEFYFKESKVI